MVIPLLLCMCGSETESRVKVPDDGLGPFLETPTTLLLANDEMGADHQDQLCKVSKNLSGASTLVIRIS